ncbi:MAG: ParA family protein [Rhodobacteraceae bacterium]|nr:ParA family protein [Paracoccaceae bacterium]
MGAVWVLTTPKGGAGKTTLALVLAGELARLGKTVEIIDADANAPIITWTMTAANAGRTIGGPGDATGSAARIHVTRAAQEAAAFRGQITTAQARADFTIIDTEGTNNPLSTFAIAAANLVIVPMQASPEDGRHALRAVEFAAEVGAMRGAAIPTVVVLTRTGVVRDSAQRTVERTIAEQAAARHLVLCPVRLAERGAYRTILLEGCTLDALAVVNPVTGLETAQQNAAALLRALAGCYREILAGRQNEAATPETAA